MFLKIYKSFDCYSFHLNLNNCYCVFFVFVLLSFCFFFVWFSIFISLLFCFFSYSSIALLQWTRCPCFCRVGLVYWSSSGLVKLIWISTIQTKIIRTWVLVEVRGQGPDWPSGTGWPTGCKLLNQQVNHKIYYAFLCEVGTQRHKSEWI